LNSPKAAKNSLKKKPKTGTIATTGTSCLSTEPIPLSQDVTVALRKVNLLEVAEEVQTKKTDKRPAYRYRITPLRKAATDYRTSLGQIAMLQGLGNMLIDRFQLQANLRRDLGFLVNILYREAEKRAEAAGVELSKRRSK